MKAGLRLMMVAVCLRSTTTVCLRLTIASSTLALRASRWRWRSWGIWEADVEERDADEVKDKAVAGSEVGDEAAACSEAEVEAVACFRAKVEDSRQQ
jgi:hypothetical protein